MPLRIKAKQSMKFHKLIQKNHSFQHCVQYTKHFTHKLFKTNFHLLVRRLTIFLQTARVFILIFIFKFCYDLQHTQPIIIWNNSFTNKCCLAQPNCFVSNDFEYEIPIQAYFTACINILFSISLKRILLIGNSIFCYSFIYFSELRKNDIP